MLWLRAPGGTTVKVPAFWSSGNRWVFRYASVSTGIHAYHTVCSDAGNAGLHGAVGEIKVVPYRGDNGLYRHGPIRIAADNRHFEHMDGEPFLWLGDTWWKGLCKRLSWDGFQELTADRKAKGFSVVQIVCGPYPDEWLFEPRRENEAGMPYKTRDFSVVNLQYFDYADRRIRSLIDAGIVPKIRAAIARRPALPALIGEACYEGNMRSAFQDIERYLFWTSMLSGAAGHTYGAAGVWHASVNGDRAISI